MAANLTRILPFCKHSLVSIAVLAVLLSSTVVIAKESPVNRRQTSSAKKLTISALKDIESGKWDEARKKIAQSKDPLAAKIYYWILLTNTEKKEWTNNLFIKLSRFVRENPEWPSVKKMKLRAEGVMPEDLSNAEVLAWYNDFPPITTYGMGRYMDALIIEGEKDKAREFVADWWASTLVSRDQQRDIFKKYGRYLTLDAHKKRFNALLHHQEYDSARGVASVLGQGYPALAKARIALARGKTIGLSKLIDKVPVYLKDDPGLLYERLKWRRKRDLDRGALEILAKAPDSDLILNRKDWWAERHIMIRRVLEKGQYGKAYKLADAHIQKDGFAYAQAQWVAGWLALRFMNKPTQGYERFIALYQKVKTPVSKARAAYWAGRAASALKQEKLAQSWYKKAAEFKTVYYGQLAGAAISMKGGLPRSKLSKLSRSELRNYKKNELFQAYELFNKTGTNDRAESFLYAFLANNETAKSYKFAAEIVAKQGDYYGSVRIAKKATKKGLFLTRQSYPTITKKMTNIHSAEWALIHALIRQESMFDYKASSGAGALGLMQLMPRTAREVSKKVNVSYNKEWLTSRPEYNILLGSSYIAQLVERYDGSYPMAIAAYNAGPSRVNSWVKLYGDPRTGQINYIDWVELIPIYETRNYVQRVMENTYIYRLRLKNIQRQPENQLHVAIHRK